MSYKCARCRYYTTRTKYVLRVPDTTDRRMFLCSGCRERLRERAESWGGELLYAAEVPLTGPGSGRSPDKARMHRQERPAH